MQKTLCFFVQYTQTIVTMKRVRKWAWVKQSIWIRVEFKYLHVRYNKT